MGYSHDMNGEDKVVFEVDEGWHDFEIVSIKPSKSKSGNDMFILKVVLDNQIDIGTDVYLLAEKGKRWLLKQLLTACGCNPNEDGTFNWDESDVEGKKIQGFVKHQQEQPWIDRQGKEQPGKLRARIVGFDKKEE